MKIREMPLNNPFNYLLGAVGVAIVLYLLSLHSYLLFHTIAEGFSIVVAFGMFAVAWHTRKYSKDVFLLFLGVAYVIVAGIDFLHTLAYRGMGIFETPGANPATQLWVAARYIQSISLLIAPFFLKRRLKPGRLVGIYLFAAVLAVASIFRWHLFPVCFLENSGLTPFKVVSELIIMCILTGAFLILRHKRHLIDTNAYHLLSASVVVTIFSEASFTLYNDPFGIANFAGHLLKIIGFFLTYKAIIVGTLEKPYGSLFGNLHLANERLRASEEHFRNSFELSGVGKAEADPVTGRFLRVNRRFTEITGYDEEEMLNMSYADITHPDDREKDERKITPVATGEKDSWNTEKRYVRKNGTVIWVAVYGTVIRDDEGTALYSMADIADITERKKAEERLRFHAGVLRQVEDMVIVIDTDEIITYMNRRAGEEYGVSHETAVGRKLSEVYEYRWVSSDDEAASHVALQRDGRWQGENTHVKNDGSEIVVQSTVSVIRDEKGAVTGFLAVMNNITRRKEAERQIASLAKFPEENPFPVMRLTRDGTVLYANKPALQLLGEWGCGTGDVLREEQCPPFYRAASSDTQLDVEVTTAGQWFSMAVVPVAGQNYFNVYGKDITERKKTQELLMISERRYALAQRAANIGTWEWHIQSGKLHWSEQIEPMFGLEPGSFDCTYEGFIRCVHPDDRKRVAETVEKAFASGTTDYSVEHRITRPDGTVRWMQENAVTLSGRDGTPERMIGIVADVTQQYAVKRNLEEKVHQISEEKYEAEEQLKQRQEALEAVYAIITSFGTSLNVICDEVVTSIAGILRVPQVSFCAITDGAITMSVQYSNGVLSHDNESETPCPRCKSVLSSGKVFQCTGDVTAEDFDCTCFTGGNSNPYTYIAVPIINYDGAGVGILCALRDDRRKFEEYEEHLIGIFARYIAYEITRRKLEETMVQSREMHLLGQLTSGVAHEVRNPLNALMAISEALFKKIGDTETYEQYIIHIRNQIRRLSRLMEDLLALGRPSQEDDFIRIGIRQLLEESIAVWQSINVERKDRIDFDSSKGQENIFVTIDRDKIQQVIMNILDNAEQHLPPDGKIAVVVDRPEYGTVRISCRDTGSGIPEENLGKIFEPFFTTRKSGTGLGLSIVKNTIENHRGTITVSNNTPSPGATVEIKLPSS